MVDSQYLNSLWTLFLKFYGMKSKIASDKVAYQTENRLWSDGNLPMSLTYLTTYQ